MALSVMVTVAMLVETRTLILCRIPELLILLMGKYCIILHKERTSAPIFGVQDLVPTMAPVLISHCDHGNLFRMTIRMFGYGASRWICSSVRLP